jgi:hypothetical protein
MSESSRFRRHLQSRGKASYFSDRVLSAALAKAKVTQQDRHQAWKDQHRPVQHALEQGRLVYDLGEGPPGTADCSVQLVAAIVKDHMLTTGGPMTEAALQHALADEGSRSSLPAIHAACEQRLLQKGIEPDGVVLYALMP